MPPQLIALFSSLLYSTVAISARLGLRHSTPLTGTCIALSVRTLTLWTAVFATGGIPQVKQLPVLLFIILGVLQSATSLLTFIGISKIGAARSQPLRSSYPLWSALIAITILQEEAGIAVLAGTVLVVGGVILISWRPAGMSPAYRWWHICFSLGASLLAGTAFPVRRYALTISNEPLFFAALLAVVSWTCLMLFLSSGISEQQLVWHPKALAPFVVAGGFETLAALLSLVAISIGRVVVVAPIVATSPLWTLVLTVLFLRGLERVNLLTALGILSVMAGTITVIASG